MFVPYCKFLVSHICNFKWLILLQELHRWLMLLFIFGGICLLFYLLLFLPTVVYCSPCADRSLRLGAQLAQITRSVVR